MAWTEWREHRQYQYYPDRVEVSSVMNGTASGDTAATLGALGTAMTVTPFSMSTPAITWTTDYDGTPTLVAVGHIKRLDAVRTRTSVKFVAYLKES